MLSSDEFRAMPEPQFNKEEIKEGAPFAALAYVFFLWIFTFIFKKDNYFARFHAKNGIVIFVGNFACFAFMFILILGVLFGILQLVLVLASLCGIFLSLTGKYERIYFVSDIADKLIV